MKPKICVVTTISKTVEFFLLDTLKYVKENGFDVAIACEMDDAFIKRNQDLATLLPLPVKRGVDPMGAALATYKLFRFFRKNKFDIVQYATPNASLYASLAAFAACIPNRVYSQWGIRYVGFSGVKRKIFKCLEKLACTLSTAVEPDSFGNLHFCSQERLYSTKKGHVIWNGSAAGVNLDKFDIQHKDLWRKEIRSELGISEDSFVFGFVGRITRDKGINELFEAAQMVFRTDPNARLVFVGDDEGRDTISPDLMEWATNEPRIHFCGKKLDVEKYLSAMDLFVLPSYREGFGSVVIEAEVMGVPVVVSNIPGPTDAMLDQETGSVVQVKDSEDLGKAILDLARNSEKRKEYGEKAYLFAKEKFDSKVLREFIVERRRQMAGISHGTTGRV